MFFLCDTYRTAIRNSDYWSKGSLQNLQTFQADNSLVGYTAPWTLDPTMDKNKPCRILVCGNSRAGKSTLLNNVFGITLVSKTSSRTVTNLISSRQRYVMSVREFMISTGRMSQIFIPVSLFTIPEDFKQVKLRRWTCSKPFSESDALRKNHQR